MFFQPSRRRHRRTVKDDVRDALAIGEYFYDLQRPTIAVRLNNLAQLLQDISRLVEAEPLMRRALTSFSIQLGYDHRNTITIRWANERLLAEMEFSPEEISRRVQAATAPAAKLKPILRQRRRESTSLPAQCFVVLSEVCSRRLAIVA